MAFLTEFAFGDYSSVAVPAEVTCFPEAMIAVVTCCSEAWNEVEERS